MRENFYSVLTASRSVAVRSVMVVGERGGECSLSGISVDVSELSLVAVFFAFEFNKDSKLGIDCRRALPMSLLLDEFDGGDLTRDKFLQVLPRKELPRSRGEGVCVTSVDGGRLGDGVDGSLVDAKTTPCLVGVLSVSSKAGFLSLGMSVSVLSVRSIARRGT
eukprot:m.127880 g.127880  ORF g.127880 m.127880 type:complete len:163 (+) comp23563_c0_seq1:48-536(+)